MNSISISGSISITGSVGSIGITGSTGYQGTSGPGGFQITDYEKELMKKYPRFNIKTEYDAMTFNPIHVVIDNNTNKEYKINHTSMNETEQFIQTLIITIREDKINTLINGSES